MSIEIRMVEVKRCPDISGFKKSASFLKKAEVHFVVSPKTQGLSWLFRSVLGGKSPDQGSKLTYSNNETKNP